MKNKVRVNIGSEPRARNLADHQDADDFGDDRVGQEFAAHVVGVEQADVLRLEKPESDGDDNRHGAQQSGRESLLRRGGLHLGGQIQALANQQGEILQHLDHVGASLPLQDQAGDEKLEIDERHAESQVAQRVLDGRAERQFLDHLAELHAHGVEGLLGHGLQAAVDVVAGFHAAVEQVDGVGEVLFEFLETPFALENDVGDAQAAEQERDQQTQED